VRASASRSKTTKWSIALGAMAILVVVYALAGLV
jgi:hypothetical protein